MNNSELGIVLPSTAWAIALASTSTRQPSGMTWRTIASMRQKSAWCFNSLSLKRSGQEALAGLSRRRRLPPAATLTAWVRSLRPGTLVAANPPRHLAQPLADALGLLRRFAFTTLGRLDRRDPFAADQLDLRHFGAVATPEAVRRGEGSLGPSGRSAWHPPAGRSRRIAGARAYVRKAITMSLYPSTRCDEATVPSAKPLRRSEGWQCLLSTRCRADITG